MATSFEPTDDLGLSPEFLADEDIARDYDEYPSGGPRCGGPCYEYGQNTGCPGCRHCDPVDRELKPHGWGIEDFEDPALLRANEIMHSRWFGGPYHQMTWEEMTKYGAWHQERARLRKSLGTFDKKLQKSSERAWERICDGSQTYSEAAEKYARWAERATGRKVRK
jgi:hypothetical protein